MNNHQLITILFLVLFGSGALIAAGIEELIKRRKQKKRYVKNLETENRYLKRRIEAARLISELKGLDLDI